MTEVEEDDRNITVTMSPKGPPGFIKKPESDAIFFRLGYYNYMKLNRNSLIKKSELDVWYKVDLIIDWPSRLVSIYVDGVGLVN